jgi:phospholipid-binding lipoprotein MlaA
MVTLLTRNAMKDMERESSRKSVFTAVLVTLFILCPVAATAETEAPLAEDFTFAWEDDPLDDFADGTAIADPFEPINRFFFHFNDRLYFWFLQPVASNYARAVPTGIRTSVFNFFQNLRAPVRVVNNVLQAKPRETGIELSRFLINSTLGIAGLADPARKQFGLEPRIEDFGQTLGYYGMGGGFFIIWPFLGASNLRDTMGMAGDTFLSPLEYYVRADPVPGLGVATFQYVNRTSFRISDYEQFKATAFDPYLSLRDAYQQYRQNLIEDRHQQSGQPFYTDSSEGQEQLTAYADLWPAEGKENIDVGDSNAQIGNMLFELTNGAAGAGGWLRAAGGDSGL